MKQEKKKALEIKGPFWDDVVSAYEIWLNSQKDIPADFDFEMWVRSLLAPGVYRLIQQKRIVEN
jgi:hypothetical protein